MTSFLRSLQVYLGDRLNSLKNTNTAVILVIANAIILAFFQEPCANVSLDWRYVAQIIFNSLILILRIDVRVLNFFKLILAGSLSHMIATEMISLYLRYMTAMGRRCTLPIYMENEYYVLIVCITLVLIFYWICSPDRKSDKEIKTESQKFDDHF